MVDADLIAMKGFREYYNQCVQQQRAAAMAGNTAHATMQRGGADQRLGNTTNHPRSTPLFSRWTAPPTPAPPIQASQPARFGFLSRGTQATVVAEKQPQNFVGRIFARK